MPKRRKPESLTIADVEAAIERPAEDWEGDCYGVANQILEAELVEGKLIYGFWAGETSPHSLFAGRAITHHAWIELPDGRIFDPTKWCFECVEPYLFVGKYENNDGYDRAGMDVIRGMRGDYPEYNPDEDQYYIPDRLRKPIESYCKIEIHNDISFGQFFWLAHLTPEDIGFSLCRELFRWIQDNDGQVYVPMDIWNLVGI